MGEATEAGVRRTEGERVTPDGASLWTRRWAPQSTTKGAVVLVHGLGEHGGRYEQVAGALARAGYAVIAFDLRGHGRSSGRRGDTRMEPVLEDLRQLLVETQSQQDRLPLFLYGHSLGALIVLTFLARVAGSVSPAANLRARGRYGRAGSRPVPALAGAVVSAAPLRTALREQRGKVLLARVLGRLLPGLRLATGLDPAALSRDPAVVAAYRADPLVHDKASLGFARDALAATDALAAATSVGVPLLLVHGTADRIAAVEGSRELSGRLRGDVTCCEVAGGYHEPHHDLDRERVVADVIEWLSARAAPRP